MLKQYRDLTGADRRPKFLQIRSEPQQTTIILRGQKFESLMAKRRLQDGEEGLDTKAPFGQRHTAGEDVEMGEFEDPWEDEIEEEDEEEVIEGDDVEDGDDEDEDEGMPLCWCLVDERNG